MRGAVAQVCRDAARLLREGQAARAYSGLVSASRSLPMTPRLTAVLVRCALRAGTERAVITLLDAAMVTERGEVRREVRRQLSRVLRRTGQEARAAAVLNGLLMDAPDDARARFVLDVLRERVAKAKEAPSRRPPAEDDESRTKTVEVSALALSDPELGNTVVEMPVVQAPPARAPRADTVQVPLGEWAGLGRTASRGPEFPWEDEGPGKARVVTPPQGARSVPEPVPYARGTEQSGFGSGARASEARGLEVESPAEKPESMAQEASEKAPDTARPAEVAQALRDKGTEASGESPLAEGVPALVGTSNVPPSGDAASMIDAESAAASSVSSSMDTAPKSESVTTASDSAQAPSSAVVVSTGEAASDVVQAPERVVGASSTASSAETTHAPARGAAVSSGPSSTSVADLPERGVPVSSDSSSVSAADMPASDVAVSSASSSANAADVPEHVIAALGVSPSADVPEHVLAALSALLLADETRTPASAETASRASSSVEVPQAPEHVASPANAAQAPEHVAATSNASSPPADTAVASEATSSDATQTPDEKSIAAPSASSATRAPEEMAMTPTAEVRGVAASSTSPVDAASTSEEPPVAAPNAPPVFESTQVFGKRLEEASPAETAQALEEKPATAARKPSDEAPSVVAGASSKTEGHDESASERMPPRPLVSVLVPGAPSRAFDEDESTSEMLLPRPAGSAAEVPTKASNENAAATENLPPRRSEPAGTQAKPSSENASTPKKTPPRQPDAVLVPGGPSKGFDADEATSEVILPRPADASAKTPDARASAERSSSSAVLVPGAPATAFDDEESTSELIPPERVEAAKDAAASTQSRAEKPAAPRRASVLVPATAKPAFDEEESTSEVVFPQPDSATPRAPAQATPAAPKRDSTRLPSVKPTEPGTSPAPDAAPSSRGSDEGSEQAGSQRQEAQLIARRAWRELAQLYLKRADRAKDAPERAEALTRLAEVMENELQDSAGAARMYREIVELTGERTALREQVRLLSQREDASLVRRALDDAIARARTSRARAVALLTRGERQLNMGVPAKAREDFEAADALVPGMLPVLAGLVRSVSDEERFAQVERLRAACAAAPRRAPDRLEALRVLAKTAEESLGDLRIAQWAWAEVLAESPDNEQPREHLLALARRLGDLPALSQLLHAQLAREPRGPAARKAHLERVATLEAMGDAGAALAELRQAVRFEPGHKEAWLLLADRCTEREQFGEAAWALENAATATEDDEERQHTWERLALFCREVLHNTEKARLYARRAESLRKSREQRARPPPPDPARTAPPQTVGVPPPSVLVAPPSVLVSSKRKDLSDEVTSNTDVPSLLKAEEASADDAPAKRSPRAKDGTARKAKASAAVSKPKAPSGRHAPVGTTAPNTEAAHSPKASSGRHAPVGATAPNTEASRQPKAPSGRHAAAGAPAPGTDAPRQPKAPSGRHASVATTSPEAEPPRRSASTKAPAEGPASLAESAPAPSGMARALKPSRGASSELAPTPDDGASAPDRKQRAPAAPPRESTTAFGAPLPPDAELEAAVSRKAATAPEDNASPAARASKNAGTQIREAPARVERAPRAGHAPRLPLSASGVEPPAPPRAPLSASGVEPPAPAPRAMAGASRPVAPPARGRGAPEAPPDIPLLSQIPSEDEDEDAMELGDGPVEATSVIAWEAPPGRMDPVRRIHRAGRPEGTVAGPAPTRPQAGGRPTVGSTETRETPAAVLDAAPPADATSAEPIVFKLVRERPLDPKPYRGLVDHFDQRGDVTRAALMRELADALEGRDVPAPRVQRGPLSNQERAGLRHPGLRTPSGELLACVGIALCRLFPSPARIASTSEPLRASAGPGATAILDALHTTARLLGVPLPELVAGDDDTANITPLHTSAPRLVVGRLLVQQPPTNAELRFHAGRALFSLSPDLLALRALRKDHLLRALALLSSVLKNPKDAGDDARVVRESLSPRGLERAALLMEPGTRDFDASLLVAAARDSANRAGLVACGGPGPALTALRARRPHDSELEELVRFAASERYLALRDAAEAGRTGR
ncbi:hypothetical protein [Corallococcus caeni]|uniref:hypothetical protein n=1 Tax=Corallococcus caeni TaxID=3082388 RepID=UPI0030C6D1DF